MIGLDTSAIIDIFRGNEAVRQVLEKNTEPLAATIVNYLELFFGLDLEKRSHKEEAAYYREFFDSVYTFNLTKESCEEASNTYQQLKRAGKRVEAFDCAIASIFIANGVTKILTRNVKDFEKVSQLKALSY